MAAASRRYRLVAADIDGTLLDSASVLRPAVVAAIQEARQAGIHFTLATGRRFASTLPLLRDIGLPSLQLRPDGSATPAAVGMTHGPAGFQAPHALHEQ